MNAALPATVTPGSRVDWSITLEQIPTFILSVAESSFARDIGTSPGHLFPASSDRELEDPDPETRIL
jgi:hypothetical protein